MGLNVWPWEGIALLPFIDEVALKAAVAGIGDVDDMEGLEQTDAVAFRHDSAASWRTTW